MTPLGDLRLIFTHALLFTFARRVRGIPAVVLMAWETLARHMPWRFPALRLGLLGATAARAG